MSLDFGNSMLASLPVYLTQRLQLLLNVAADCHHLQRSDHITDALVCLDWLHTLQQVQFKITVQGYKVVHVLAPQYLGPLNRVTDLPSHRSLHSASTSHLVVLPIRQLTVTNQAFPVVGPRISNDISADVTSAESLYTYPSDWKPISFQSHFLDISCTLTTLFQWT